MKTRTEVYSEKLAKLRTWRYAHIKRDGHFLEVYRAVTGEICAWTSRPKNIISELKDFSQFAHWQDLPHGAIFQGELWQPGTKGAQIKTRIVERSPALRFDVFGIRQYPGVAPYVVDGWKLCEVERRAAAHGFNFLPWLTLSGHVDFSAMLKNLQPDVEGYVLKYANQLQWAKLKPRPTLDLIITDIQPGEGKYAGLIGSLTVSTAEGFEVAHVSGMTDELRVALSNNVEALRGQVIEVAYQEIGTQGRLRHPSFVRFREDKSPEACTIEQDEELVAFWGSKVSQRKLF